jgi:hypothetical protein
MPLFFVWTEARQYTVLQSFPLMYVVAAFSHEAYAQSEVVKYAAIYNEGVRDDE